MIIMIMNRHNNRWKNSLGSGIFHDHVIYSITHLQYDSFGISLMNWMKTTKMNNPKFDSCLTKPWPVDEAKNYNNLTRQCIDDNCRKLCPAVIVSKCRLNRNFLIMTHHIRISLRLRWEGYDCSPLRQSRIRSINYNYTNCGFSTVDFYHENWKYEYFMVKIVWIFVIGPDQNAI